MNNTNKLATEILALNEKWEESYKKDIAENVEHYLVITYPECKRSAGLRIEKLMEMTSSNKQAVYSWLNRSRENVKVPFLKLCMIAKELDVDIEDLLARG